MLDPIPASLHLSHSSADLLARLEWYQAEMPLRQDVLKNFGNHQSQCIEKVQEHHVWLPFSYVFDITTLYLRYHVIEIFFDKLKGYSDKLVVSRKRRGSLGSISFRQLFSDNSSNSFIRYNSPHDSVVLLHHPSCELDKMPAALQLSIICKQNREIALFYQYSVEQGQRYAS